MPKKIPIRQCVACRVHAEKPMLARIVRTPEGAVVYDPRGKVAGRGAYICKQVSCLEKAIKTKALSRALETPVEAELFEALRAQMKEAGDGG